MSANTPATIVALCDRIRALEGAVTRPTLVYFDIIGIAWPIRCALHIEGVDYELIQLSIIDWIYRDGNGRQLVKECFTNGHVPFFADSEIRLNQSSAIMNYLAEKYGLAGSSTRERFAASEVMSHAYDALFHWNGLLQVIIRMGIPDDVVTARVDSFMGNGIWGLVTDGYKNHLDGFARYLAANPESSGFFAGDALTMADLHAFNVLCNWYKAFAPERFVTEYPALEDFVQRVAAIPKIREYIRHVQEPTTWFPLPDVAIRLTSHEELEGLAG